jgi:hypothetical protein
MFASTTNQWCKYCSDNIFPVAFGSTCASLTKNQLLNSVNNVCCLILSGLNVMLFLMFLFTSAFNSFDCLFSLKISGASFSVATSLLMAFGQLNLFKNNCCFFVFL